MNTPCIQRMVNLGPLDYRTARRLADRKGFGRCPVCTPSPLIRIIRTGCWPLPSWHLTL